MTNWLLGEELGVYYFLFDLRLKIEIQGLWLARFYIDGTSVDINSCFVKLAIDKIGRIDIGGIITFIQRLVISDYFSLSPLSLTSSQSGVFNFFFGFLIISMQLSLHLHKRHVEVMGRIVLVFSSALLLFKLLSIIVWYFRQ